MVTVATDVGFLCVGSQIQAYVLVKIGLGVNIKSAIFVLVFVLKDLAAVNVLGYFPEVKVQHTFAALGPDFK